MYRAYRSEASRRPRHWVGWSGALWVLLSVVILVVPLAHILGYESAIAINLMVVLIGGPRVLHTHRDAPLWSRLWWRCADLLFWVSLSGILLALNGLRVRNCDVAGGLGFWLMFGVGSIPPVVALGLLCERLGRRGRPWTRYGLYLGIVCFSMVCSGLWLALEPPLVVYDAFAGYWAVSIYDAALGAWYTHAAYRAMTLVGAALWCHAIAFEDNPSPRGAGWVGALGLALGLMIAFAPVLNISRSRGYIDEMLGGRIETPHFVIHYDAAAFTPAQLRLLIADHEMRYAQLERFWEIVPTGKIQSYIYGSADRREQAMGVRHTMIARVWLNEMHLVWDGFGDPLLAHEMSHLMLRNKGHGPLRLSSAHGVFPLMGLVEGAASAAAWEVDDLTDHGWAAAILATGQMEDLSTMMRASSFWSQASSLSYTLWGSFCRWLIDTRGATRFLNAYYDGNFERAYGESMDALVAQWQDMLRTITLTPAEKAAARMRFEQPSLLQRVCGRAIAQRKSEAHKAIVRRKVSKAQSAVGWLAEHDDHDPYLQLQVARMWTRLGEDNKAAAIYAELAQNPDVGIALMQHARLRQADLAWAQDDDARAIAEIEIMKQHPLTATLSRAVWVREALITERAQHPAAYDAGRRYLVRSWLYRPLAVRLDLLAAALQERSVPAAWLAYRMSEYSALGSAAEALTAILRSDSLPHHVAQRFALDQLARAARAGGGTACRNLRAPTMTDSTSIGHAVSDEAQFLRRRCHASGLYLDAAQSAME